MSRFVPVSALAELDGAIQSFLEKNVLKLDGAEKMQPVEERLRASIQPGCSLSAKHVCKAVSAFLAKGADRLTRREVRALCAGLNHSCVVCGNESLMVAAPETVHDLFMRFRRAFREKKLQLESWYDLLQCYLGAKDRTVCCEMLRDLLAETFPGIAVAGNYPFRWLPTLSANRNILDKEPCAGVAEQTVRGRNEEIEALRHKLEIPDTSWFWRELTTARAIKAAQQDDAGFMAAMPGLLQAAHFLPERQRDQVIRHFLERCVTCKEPGAQEELKAFTVEHWGAPPPGSHPKYDLVGAEARLLVQEWLSREDLRDFFTLLQAAGPDERKLAFWNRYIKSIEYHRILLGPEAQRTPQLHIAKLRSRPNMGRLAGAGDANNALLMKIGAWIVVESAGAETPIYGYRFAKLPFDPEAVELDLPCFRKGGQADFRLERKDTLEGQWEDRLAPELATLGIKRDGGDAKKKGAAAAPARASQSAPQPAAPSERFDNDIFWKMVKEGHLQAEDTRGQGGALWVVGDLKDNYYLAQQLAAWGFKWKTGRGWWRY